MKFFAKGKDGGPESHVTGYWLVEIKSLFSIVLLRFDYGSRDVYHTHAFNALTWWLWGAVEEAVVQPGRLKNVLTWKPSLMPKYTPRSLCHKVFARQTSWALSFRGPWRNTWMEYEMDDPRGTRLTHGRREV